MKVIAVLALFAVCSSASANIFRRQMLNRNCYEVDDFINASNLAFCFESSSTEEFCGDDCAGQICTYFSSNGYSALCDSDFAAVCLEDGYTPAVSCQRCFDVRIGQLFSNLPDTCSANFWITRSQNFDPQAFCTDECAGQTCSYYKENGYSTDCLATLALECTESGLAVPTACELGGGSGALALVTTKGVAAIVLLVAAFCIF